MYKKIILSFIFVLFFTFFKVSFASLIINEIQISPTENRFIELYNSGEQDINLTGYYIQRKTENGSSFTSLVSSTNFENKKISKNSFFLISRNNISNTDIVVPNLTITESNTIQIKNSEGEVIDKICFGVANDCSNALKSENPTEGKSIQRLNNSLIISSPTPKINNTTSENNSENNTEENTTEQENNILINNPASSSFSQISNPKIISEKLQINTSKLGFVGIPISLEAIILNQEFKNIYGKFLWNFGDGNFKEVKSIDNNKFSYIYNYPGKYNVYLEYYKNTFDINPTLLSEISIEIILPTIVISHTGEQDNFFIELTNKTNYDINLQNFILYGQYNKFIFPRNTFLKKDGKIILSPEATNFNLNDKNFLELRDASNKIIFSNKILATPIVKKKIASIEGAQSQNIITGENNYDEIGGDYTSENFDLEALSLSSNKNQNLFQDSYFLITLFLILFAIFIVLLIRKNIKQSDVDDFEILDE